MYLVDTNVLSELVRQAPEPRLSRWVDRHGAESGVPSTAVFELWSGIAVLPDGRRRDQLFQATSRLIDRFGPRVYALDRRCAEAAGELIGTARRQGRQLERLDAQIAGIAAVYGLTLVTRNIRDFETTGLDLLDPWAAD